MLRKRCSRISQSSMSIVLGGEIFYDQYGLVIWSIDISRELWGKHRGLYSPNFNYLGKNYHLQLEKQSKTQIYAKFVYYHCNVLYVESQLLLDCTIVSDLSGNLLRFGGSRIRVLVDFSSLHPRLIVHCCRRKLTNSDVLPDELQTVNKMLKDLKNLLASGENSDVTLLVGGKKIPVHRTILCARSPVFKAMLCHDMSERDSGTVSIDDCDPDKFQDFLTYVYTGSTRHIDNGNVVSLYTTSDKYLMCELKEACVSFMKANMSVEGFCGIVTLALLHDEQELVELATTFFCNNKKEIIETENWATFFEENPKQAYEHFIKPSIRRR